MVRTFADGQGGKMLRWPYGRLEWHGWCEDHPSYARCHAKDAQGKTFYVEVAWENKKDIKGWEFFPFPFRMAPKERSPSPVKKKKQAAAPAHALESLTNAELPEGEGAQSLGSGSVEIMALGHQVTLSPAPASGKRKKSMRNAKVTTTLNSSPSRPKRTNTAREMYGVL